MVNPGKEGQLGPSTKKQHDMSSAADKAYTKIRTAILTGELGHGENLSERELGLRIGLSRTPVREAINRLRIEGLVLLERNSRNFVARFSGKDVEEILGLKAILEGHAATPYGFIRAGILLVWEERWAVPIHFKSISSATHT